MRLDRRPQARLDTTAETLVHGQVWTLTQVKKEGKLEATGKGATDSRGPPKHRLSL